MKKNWLDKASGFALGEELVRERLKGSGLKSSSSATDPDFALLGRAIFDIKKRAAKRSKSVVAGKRVGAKSRSSAKARLGKASTQRPAR